MGRKINQHHGFTLIELLVVVAVIALLSVLAINVYFRQIAKGNDARRKADINRIKIAVEEYEKDKNCYPQYVTCGSVPSQPIYPYLRNVPCDPLTKKSYTYNYENSTCPNWYIFYSKLQNSSDGSITIGVGPSSAFNYYSGSANAPTPVNSEPTASPTGVGGNIVPSGGLFGCRQGVCVPIKWNPNRKPEPGPECDVSYKDDTGNCFGNCGPAAAECIMVN